MALLFGVFAFDYPIRILLCESDLTTVPKRITRADNLLPFSGNHRTLFALSFAPSMLTRAIVLAG